MKSVNEAIEKGIGDYLKTLAGQGYPVPSQPGEELTPTRMYGAAAQAGWLKGSKPDKKKAIDDYDQTRSGLFWPADHKIEELRGKRLTTPSQRGPGMGKPLDTQSKADEAVCGAYFKWACAVNKPGDTIPRGLQMTDHDWQLVKYAIHEMPWTGRVQSDSVIVDDTKLTDFHVKALLDDSVSGGIEAVPSVLDNAIIQTPLLMGEIFPLVDVINIDRGRKIEAWSMGRPTMTWGIAEGTAIPLFDTTGFIGALDTTIFPCVGSMQIGNDFEEDSPANVGAMVIRAYGDAAMETLDKVVVLGDGTTQPKGIFNTAGVTAVSSTGGAAGPVAIGDLEGLMFGVDKKFRTSRGGNRNVFLGNEVTYRRIRGIPTAATYNTRVFGMNYGDYTALGFPYRIHPLIPNNKLAFVNMAWYRMWRRLGTQVKVEDRGQTLVQLNCTLISVRMRYGGQMTLGGAAAVITDLMA
jgi:HK97 family phage major capsid protein